MANEEIKNEKVETKEVKTEKNNTRRNNDKRAPRKSFEKKQNMLEEKVISISRVTKVTKGGRHFRFSATVAVGNRKGLVGMGSGKANEVPEAIKKALQAANKNVSKVALIDNRTIPHEAQCKVGRAVVLIKPAKKGTGVIAGGAARAILELAGVKDIVSKSLGSNTQVNVAKATLEALKSERTPEKIAALRGKKVEEL
jgi:small subunit ribosomal protein S5